MDIKEAFAKALKQARNARGLTQEAFSDGSSRTYISTLERKLKSPTLEKIETLSRIMKVHPLTLMALTYLIKMDENNIAKLTNQITKELSLLKNNVED